MRTSTAMGREACNRTQYPSETTGEREYPLKVDLDCNINSKLGKYYFFTGKKTNDKELK